MSNMRILGIDYGDARVGIAISDPLGITSQGLETIHHGGNDKKVLKRLEEILEEYEIGTIVIGMPFNMDGTSSERIEITNKFIHKLKCKFNKIKIETIDERLTTVAAHKTMNILNIDRKNKRNIVKDKKYWIYVTLSIVSVELMILQSNNDVMARLELYFSYFFMLSLPYFIENNIQNNDKYFIYIVLMIVLFVPFLLKIKDYLPYSFFG